MKIRKINIETYNTVVGFNEELDENMTLIYGDNEAGKTSISEFIRSTLFPGKVKYPKPKKSDNGTIEVEMSNGDIRTSCREHNKVYVKDGKPPLIDDLHIDSETYKTIFALDREQLVNDKLIASGDFKKKFLTIPGGENVPVVSKEIVNEMNEYLSKQRLGRFIGKIKGDIEQTQKDIAEKEENIEIYNELAMDLDALYHKISVLREQQNEVDFKNNKQQTLNALSENIQRLEEYKSERESYLYSEKLSDEDEDLYLKLKNNLSALQDLLQSYDEVEEDEEKSAYDMKPEEVELFVSNKDEIEDLFENEKNSYVILETTLDDLKQTIKRDTESIESFEKEYKLDVPTVKEVVADRPLKESLFSEIYAPDNKITMEKKIIVIIVSLILALAGFVVKFIPLSVVGILMLVGILLYPYVIKTKNADKQWESYVEEYPCFSNMEKDQAKKLYRVLEEMNDTISRRDRNVDKYKRFSEDMRNKIRDIDAIVSKYGFSIESCGSVSSAIKEVYSLYVIATNKTSQYSQSEGTYLKIKETTEELEALYEKYGSEENIQNYIRDKKKLKELDRDIETLSKLIESVAGKTSDVISESINEEEVENVDYTEEINVVNQKIGEIKNEMNNILNNDELVGLKNKLASEEKSLCDAALNWGMLSLADHIIGECCTRFYSDLQPNVIKTANRYLDLMTEGRYRFATDPRNEDISIEDRKGSKRLGEWSTALIDQVYLSLKMAIAKEMGVERVPFILDDVLLAFDNRRKQGACRAIIEFSKDQQTIMFTCDNTLISMFNIEGNVNVIKLI